MSVVLVAVLTDREVPVMGPRMWRLTSSALSDSSQLLACFYGSHLVKLPFLFRETPPSHL